MLKALTPKKKQQIALWIILVGCAVLCFLDKWNLAFMVGVPLLSIWAIWTSGVSSADLKVRVIVLGISLAFISFHYYGQLEKSHLFQTKIDRLCGWSSVNQDNQTCQRVIRWSDGYLGEYVPR